MLIEDADAWECDMAETYGLIDVESIPLRKLARLSAGLREDSRIKKKMSGENISLTEQLLALAVDRLSWLKWSRTKAAQEGQSPPPSIYDILMSMNEPREEQEEIVLTSREDFYKRWNSEE